MQCERCGEHGILFVVAGEKEGFPGNVGWCESCIRKEPRLKLVPYEREQEREIARLMSHQAKWYKEVQIMDKRLLRGLKRGKKR